MAYRLYTDAKYHWVVPNDAHPWHASALAPPFIFSEHTARLPAQVPDEWNHARHTMVVDRVTHTVYVVDSDTGETLNSVCPPAFAPENEPQDVITLPLPSSRATCRLIEGLAGAVYLMRGLYLVLITHARPVASVMGRAYLEVLGTEMLPVSDSFPSDDLNRSSSITNEETHVVAAFQRHLDSSSWIFSRDSDTTLTLQRAHDFATASRAARLSAAPSSSASAGVEDGPQPLPLPNVVADGAWSKAMFCSELVGRAEDLFFANRPHVATLLHAHACSLAMLSPSTVAAAALPPCGLLSVPLHTVPALTSPALARVAPALHRPVLPSAGAPSLVAPFCVQLVAGSVATSAHVALPRDAAAAGGDSEEKRKRVSMHSGSSDSPDLLTVTLISRRGRHRTGSPQQQSGVDARGRAGLLVEVECIVQRYRVVADPFPSPVLACSSATSLRRRGGRALAPRLLLCGIASHVTLRTSPPVPFSLPAPRGLSFTSPLRFPAIAPLLARADLAQYPAPFAVPAGVASKMLVEDPVGFARVVIAAAGAAAAATAAAAAGKKEAKDGKASSTVGGFLDLAKVFAHGNSSKGGDNNDVNSCPIPLGAPARVLSALALYLDSSRSPPNGSSDGDADAAIVDSDGWTRCLVAAPSLWCFDAHIRRLHAPQRVFAARRAAAAAAAAAASPDAAAAAASGAGAWGVGPATVSMEPLLHVVSLVSASDAPGAAGVAARTHAAVAAFNMDYIPPVTGGPAVPLPGLGQFPLLQQDATADAEAVLGGAAAEEHVKRGGADVVGLVKELRREWLPDGAAGTVGVVGDAAAAYFPPVPAPGPFPARIAGVKGAVPTASAAAASRARAALAATAASPVAYHSLTSRCAFADTTSASATTPADLSGGAANVELRLSALARRCGVFAVSFACLDEAAPISDALAEAESEGVRVRWAAQEPLGASTGAGTGVGVVGGVCGVVSRVTVPVMEFDPVQAAAFSPSAAAAAAYAEAPGAAAGHSEHCRGQGVVSRQQSFPIFHCLTGDRSSAAQTAMCSHSLPSLLLAAAPGWGSDYHAHDADDHSCCGGYDETLAAAVVRTAAAAGVGGVLLSPLPAPPAAQDAGSGLARRGGPWQPDSSILSESPLASAPAVTGTAAGSVAASAVAAAAVAAACVVNRAVVMLWNEIAHQGMRVTVGTDASDIRSPTALPGALTSLVSESDAATIPATAEVAGRRVFHVGCTHTAHRAHISLCLPLRPSMAGVNPARARALLSDALDTSAAAAAAAPGKKLRSRAALALAPYALAHSSPASAAAGAGAAGIRTGGQLRLPAYAMALAECVATGSALSRRGLAARAGDMVVAGLRALASPIANPIARFTRAKSRATIARTEYSAIDDQAAIFSTAYRPQRHLLPFVGAKVVKQPAAEGDAGAARFMVEPMPPRIEAEVSKATLLIVAAAVAGVLTVAVYFGAQYVPIPSGVVSFIASTPSAMDSALAAGVPDYAVSSSTAGVLEWGLLPTNLPSPEAIARALMRARVGGAFTGPLPTRFPSLASVVAAYDLLTEVDPAAPALSWRLFARRWPLLRVCGLGLALFVALGLVALAWGVGKAKAVPGKIEPGMLGMPSDFAPPLPPQPAPAPASTPAPAPAADAKPDASAGVGAEKKAAGHRGKNGNQNKNVKGNGKGK